MYVCIYIKSLKPAERLVRLLSGQRHLLSSPDDLSLILGNYIVEGEKAFHQVVLTFTHIMVQEHTHRKLFLKTLKIHAYIHTQIHTERQFQKVSKNVLNYKHGG